MEIAVRHHALAISSTLSRMGELAIPVLVNALSNKLNEDLREYAVRALVSMGDTANGAIPALIEALDDPADEVRTYSAYALANFGEAASEAIPALVKAFDDESDRVKHHVAFALEKIGTPEAHEALRALL